MKLITFRDPILVVFQLGGFYEYPLAMSYFSLRTEFLLSKFTMKFNQETDYKDIDLIINTISVKIPLLIKYTFPYEDRRPYIDMGVYYGLSVQNDSQLYIAESERFTNYTYITHMDIDPTISRSQLGYTFGIGYEIDRTDIHTVNFELRYVRNKGILTNLSDHSNSINLLIGFNF